jgi:hypothetical protein
MSRTKREIKDSRIENGGMAEIGKRIDYDKRASKAARAMTKDIEPEDPLVAMIMLKNLTFGREL